MCGRFTLRTPANIYARFFNLAALQELMPALRFNIAPSQDVAVVRTTERGRELAMLRWGLIPSWASDPKIGYSMINARSETAAEKPAFRSAMKQRRCLILADGFYEWRKEGKQKLPIYIRLRNERPFAFAGLWERWTKGTGEPIESCTILTTTANELLKPLHDRMPVILAPNDCDAWLNPETTDPSQLSYLFEPTPDDELIATPANPAVNSARYDAPDCLQPA